MMHMRRYKKKLLLLVIIIGGIFLAFNGISVAKYVSSTVKDYYLKSRGFYFNSDHLGSVTTQNVDNLWDGESVEFNIRNNLNQEVISTYDIGYEVSCTVKGELSEYVACYLNGKGTNEDEGVLSSFQTCINNTGDGVDVSLLNKTECELGGYKWVYQIAKKDMYFDIVALDEGYEFSDVEVNVTVTSTYPYKKTLSGDFILHKRNIEEEEVTLDYKNYSNYGRLIISNSYPETKCVGIYWDASELVIDADMEKIPYYGTDEDGFVDEIRVEIDGKKSISYIFYKKDFAKTHNAEDFVIWESEGCDIND